LTPCVAALALACGDDGTGRGDGFEEGISMTSLGDSGTGTAGDGDGDPGDGEGDGDPGDGDGDGSPCMGGGTDATSYIWIANSGEGTVSKIDTMSGVELGRYIVRADSAGSPSRTSVNNRGDVAVANRLGGVTMVRANVDDCVEVNGTPGIQTSNGPGDIRPAGEEECVVWRAEIPHGDNRPVAWTSGFADPGTCTWFDRDVWTAWSDVALGTAVVALLDGET